MTKSLIIRSILSGVIFGIGLYAMLAPQAINADLNHLNAALKPATLIQNGHLTICKLDDTQYQVVKSVKMTITAYTSTPDQTDDTPFITASGAHVADGVIAINGLPFNTLIRIPEISGSKIYIVKDRMHSRKGTKHADIWFEDLKEARQFGAKVATIEIVES